MHKPIVVTMILGEWVIKGDCEVSPPEVLYKKRLEREPGELDYFLKIMPNHEMLFFLKRNKNTSCHPETALDVSL